MHNSKAPGTRGTTSHGQRQPQTAAGKRAQHLSTWLWLLTIPEASTQLTVRSFHSATAWKMQAKRCRMKMTVQTSDAIRTTTRPMCCSSCRITEGACRAAARGKLRRAHVRAGLIGRGIVHVLMRLACGRSACRGLDALELGALVSHLEQPERTHELQHADYAHKLDHLGHFEQLNKAKRFIGKHNVPWHGGKHINCKKALQSHGIRFPTYPGKLSAAAGQHTTDDTDDTIAVSEICFAVCTLEASEGSHEHLMDHAPCS